MSEPAADSSQRYGPGPRLRRARETQGLSVQQAAEQLNLDATVVTAIENDDLAALGAPVFARGHMRRYGALLGVADDELLTAYEQARTQPDQPSLVPHSRLEMAPVRSRPVWAWAIGGALLFVLAAGLVAYVSEYGLTLPGAVAPGGSGAPATEPAAVAAAEVAAAESDFAPADQAASGGSTPPPVPIDGTGSGGAPGETGLADASTQPAADGVQSTTGAESAGTASAGTVPAAAPIPPGHVSVTVTFATDSWAEVYDGAGKAVMYDLGRAGTQRTISATAPLSVTFGNAPGVTLAVNGRATALPARPAGQSVARFQVAADGTLR